MYVVDGQKVEHARKVTAAVVFIILVFEFRSFSHPIAILIATVLCTSDSLLALLVTNTTLNISSFMGIIIVVGIVRKNGILILDSEGHYTAQVWSFVMPSIMRAGEGCGPF